MRRVLWLAVVVLVVDLVTKVVLPTPSWAMHDRSWGYLVHAVPFLAFPLALLCFRRTAVGGAILLGAGIGNLMWAPFDVPNPFLREVEGGVIAFNVADVALLLGTWAAMIGLVLMAWDLTRARLRSKV